MKGRPMRGNRRPWRKAPRLLAPLLALGLALAPWPAADAARPAAREQALQRGAADTALAPLSVELVRTGDAHLGRGAFQQAIDAYESALAVDPRNVQAYLGMARAFERLGLPGRAIRFYREALAINPNDIAAIEAQGHAYLARGARGRAEDNLERLRRLCAAPCPSADRLASALARAPAMAAARPASDQPEAAKR